MDHRVPTPPLPWTEDRPQWTDYEPDGADPLTTDTTLREAEAESSHTPPSVADMLRISFPALYRPHLTPGENFRRNSLSRRKFRKLPRRSKFQRTTSFQKVQEAALVVENPPQIEDTPLSARSPSPPHLPVGSQVQPPPVTPTLTMRVLFSRTN